MMPGLANVHEHHVGQAATRTHSSKDAQGLRKACTGALFDVQAKAPTPGDHQPHHKLWGGTVATVATVR